LVADVRRTLRPGGTYALNLIDRTPRRFVRAEVATVLAEFPFVALVARRVPGCAARPAATSSYSPRPHHCQTVRGRRAPRCSPVTPCGQFVGDAQALTDDYAPVDQLLTL
jgi:hypothetical protein